MNLIASLVHLLFPCSKCDALATACDERDALVADKLVLERRIAELEAHLSGIEQAEAQIWPNRPGDK